MTIWRKRAVVGVSTATLLIVLAPMGRELEQELSVLKRVAKIELAIKRTGEARLAAMLPLPAPEPGWFDGKTPDSAALASRDIDPIATGSLGAAGEPDGAKVGASAPDPATLAMPAPPGSPTSAALLAYARGDFSALATLAKIAADPDERLGLEWAALRSEPTPAAAELGAFAAAHPTWPGLAWIDARQEADLAVRPMAPKEAIAFFEKQPPKTSLGKFAYARSLAASGRVGEAIAMVRALWREGNLDGWTESRILREFGASLQKADHKYRADRLLYAEAFGPAFRAAALAGPDMVALANARMAASRGPLSLALVQAVPQSMKGDPGLLFARIQDARRSGRIYEAATLLNLAPTNREALVNPDKWWSERRMVARKLLDINEPKLAFDLCAKAVQPDQASARVDQNFHAGWIALRFLDNPAEAAKRFALAADAAQTPFSISRAAYWRGRAAEAMGDQNGAKSFYETAAAQPIAYYGQLAAGKLGAKHLVLREPKAIATGNERDESVRAVEALYADGLDDLATSLAYDAARSWTDEAQIAAMAEVVERHADASTEVQFGKIATLRGLPFDAMAFPATGVPAFLPLTGSADLPSVYAVARQESEFVWHAASGAGAKGLMQVLPSTAANTARRAGVAYDPVRLIADPSFNTQLGAAFLGQVMGDLEGPPELAFAAYNAGPARVAQWLLAYGDPRDGKTDLVDWIERIPYDETRDYVQRVAENLAVYKQLFADAPPDLPPLSPRLARE